MLGMLWLLVLAQIQIDRVVAPIRPTRTEATGLTVFEIQVSRPNQVHTTPRFGQAPFSTAALSALLQWRFSLREGAPAGLLSVTFLFRQHQFRPAVVPSLSIAPLAGRSNSAAVPAAVVDPGHPMDSRSSGFLILEMKIDADGNIESTRALLDEPHFLNFAQDEIRKWKFRPAREATRNVPGTAIVVISFVDPYSE